MTHGSRALILISVNGNSNALSIIVFNGFSLKREAKAKQRPRRLWPAGALYFYIEFPCFLEWPRKGSGHSPHFPIHSLPVSCGFLPHLRSFHKHVDFFRKTFSSHRAPLPKSKAPAGSTLCMEPAGAFLYGYKQRSSYTIADSRPTLASSRKRGGNREPVLSVRPTPRLFSAENLGPAAIISRRTCSRCSRSTSCGAPCRPLRADGKPLCGGMH